MKTAGKAKRFIQNPAAGGRIRPRLAFFVPWLWVNGMALWPVILVGMSRPSARLINHERIHLRQQLELLVLPFYVWYLFEYLVKRLRYRGHDAAYRAISFEREAYAHDAEPGYLRRRTGWAFLKYL